MDFQTDPALIKRAAIPHDVLLFNLIGNHILITAVIGGMAGSYPWLLAIIPAISIGVLFYIFHGKARVDRENAPLFVRCHWDITARRSRVFLAMLAVVGVAIGAAWGAYHWGGMMKELAWALVGGIGILPIMLTTLVLIMMESDALNHAKHSRVPDWAYRRVTGEEPPKVAEAEAA